MLQDEPTHDSIKLLRERQVTNVSGQDGCRRAGFVSTPRTLPTPHQISGDQADIAWAAADIQYSHPRAYADILEQAAGEGVEQLALYQQTPDRFGGVPQNVILGYGKENFLEQPS